MLDDAQAQARALFRPSEGLICLSEGLEERAPEAGGDADAGVAYLKDDLARLPQTNDYAYVALLAELLRIGQQLWYASSDNSRASP